MDIWQNFRDRDYLRWRRKRLFVRFILIMVTMLLGVPVMTIFEYFFDIRGPLGFALMAGSVLFLLAIYKKLGLIGRPYIPPRRDE